MNYAKKIALCSLALAPAFNIQAAQAQSLSLKRAVQSRSVQIGLVVGASLAAFWVFKKVAAARGLGEYMATSQQGATISQQAVVQSLDIQQQTFSTNFREKNVMYRTSVGFTGKVRIRPTHTWTSFADEVAARFMQDGTHDQICIKTNDGTRVLNNIADFEQFVVTNPLAISVERSLQLDVLTAVSGSQEVNTNSKPTEGVLVDKDEERKVATSGPEHTVADEFPMVTLKTGARVPKGLLDPLTITLSTLLSGMIDKRILLLEVRRKAQNPKYKMFGDTQEQAQNYRLLEPDGTMQSYVRSIILACITGEDLDLHFVYPVTATTSMLNSSSSSSASSACASTQAISSSSSPASSSMLSSTASASVRASASANDVMPLQGFAKIYLMKSGETRLYRLSPSESFEEFKQRICTALKCELDQSVFKSGKQPINSWREFNRIRGERILSISQREQATSNSSAAASAAKSSNFTVNFRGKRHHVERTGSFEDFKKTICTFLTGISPEQLIVTHLAQPINSWEEYDSLPDKNTSLALQLK